MRELTANELHEAAMSAADDGEESYRLAFKLEKEALAKLVGVEPSFSIMSYSAAWLAYKAGLFHSAIEVAQAALSDDQDGYIKYQLETAIEWSRRALESSPTSHSQANEATK